MSALAVTADAKCQFAVAQRTRVDLQVEAGHIYVSLVTVWSSAEEQHTKLPFANASWAQSVKLTLLVNAKSNGALLHAAAWSPT